MDKLNYLAPEMYEIHFDCAGVVAESFNEAVGEWENNI